MKIRATLSIIILIMCLPVAANAQGYNNLNVNLNDAMLGEKTQEMSQELNDANSLRQAKINKHHIRHHNKRNNAEQTDAKNKNAAVTPKKDAPILMSGSDSVVY